MKKVVLSIDGMTCSACSNGLEKYLNKQNGIKSATVNLVMANALIEYDENILNLETLEKFVEEAGFKSLGIYNENSEKKQNKNEKVKFIIFSVLAVALMYISMGHMIGLPNFSFLDMHIHPLIYAGTLLALTIAFVVYGFDVIKSGCKNLIHKAPNMDTLVAMGVITSILYSIYGMYMIAKGHHEYVENLYFESAAIVIFFIKLGRYIDGISKDKTKEAIQKLVQITPKEAVIKVNGEEAAIDSKINDGDEINIIYANNGQNAAAKVMEILTNYKEKEIFINNNSTVIEPIAIINDNKVSLDTYISDQDIIEIIYPKNIGDVKKYVINTEGDIFVNEVKANDEYIIKDGDKLVFEDDIYIEKNHYHNISTSLIIEQDEESKSYEINGNEFSEKLEDEDIYAMKVIVNDEEVKIKDMSSMMFVQIFSYIDFDLSEPKGNIVLKLNGKDAAYTDIVNNGDIINIYWKK